MIVRGAWRRRGALIAELQLAGKTHGDGEGLWVVDLDVEAKGWL